MCGICGIVGWSDPDLGVRMRDVLTHRGPDGEGLYVSDGVTLGHRRLSIIDIEGGHQPMSNEDGSVWIVFNGEIYNHESLRKELGQQGHQFKSRCDTEAILHLYEERGADCVNDLRGMFAFAIWDEPRRRLLLARDRLGIKPLYYLVRGDRLLFASEIKSILQWDGYNPSVDLAALDHFLTFRYGPAQHTIFKDILKLRPGERLIWENGKIQSDFYWTLPEPDADIDAGPDEIADTLHRNIEESVRIRLESDVPLGTYLSGGVDSGYLAALVGQISERRSKTLTVRFDDSAYDESEEARSTAAHLNSDHTVVRAGEADASLLNRVLWHVEEPLADATCIPLFRLAEATKPQITVVLGGEGADELFAGYPKYFAYRYGHLGLPAWVRGLMGPLSFAAVPLGGADRLRRYLTSGAREAGDFAQLTAVWSEREKEDLYSPDIRREIDEIRTETGRDRALSAPDSRMPLSELLRRDLQTWLPDDLLLKCDKMTMAHGVELRVPYLDHQLVELAQSIPTHRKLRGLSSKWILRRAAQKALPPGITRRKKRGFSVPMETWFGRSGFAESILTRETIEAQGFFQWPHVERELQTGWAKAYPRRRLLALLMFTLWHRIFIEGRIPDDTLRQGARATPIRGAVS